MLSFALDTENERKFNLGIGYRTPLRTIPGDVRVRTIRIRGFERLGSRDHDPGTSSQMNQYLCTPRYFPRESESRLTRISPDSMGSGRGHVREQEQRMTMKMLFAQNSFVQSRLQTFDLSSISLLSNNWVTVSFTAT